MQGYITVAFGADKYFEMAVNLAKSIKRFDLKRPVCLIYDEEKSRSVSDLSIFDDRVIMPKDSQYLGCMNKIRVNNYTPYDQTMYVDADCLMVRPGIDKYWKVLEPFYFNITGEKKNSGLWNNMDISKVIQIFNIDYIVQMNSGVFYFNRSKESNNFFLLLVRLFKENANFLSYFHKNVKNQYADEPFFATAMGILNITPIGQLGSNSIMVSTWRSSSYKKGELDGYYSFKKHNKFLFGFPYFPISSVKHSPIFMHFINLKPKKIYNKIFLDLNRDSSI